MSNVNVFAGRLMKQRLPSLTPGPGVELPTLKRLALAQGEVAQFHDANPGVHYIAALELVKGSVRGNHYHTVKEEHVYMMRGQLELIAEDPDSGERVQLTMEPGDLAVIQPGLAHAFRVLREGVAIEFSPTKFDPADTHPYPLT